MKGIKHKTSQWSESFKGEAGEMVTMEKIEEIRNQYMAGESKSHIARTLGLDRKTVNKYINMDDFNESIEKLSKKNRKRGSKLDPYKAEIDELLKAEQDGNVFYKQRFTAARMHEYLWKDKGHTELKGSYCLVARYMKEKKLERKRSYSEPGTLPLVWEKASAQADFGEADFMVDGELKRQKYFNLTFPYSNRKTTQVMPGENCECVCQALKEAFEHIGGVPRRIVFDNATGIGKRVAQTLMMNPGFTRFKLHYKFAASFANPRSGWEKGNVENSVGTIRRNLMVPPMILDADIPDFNRETMLPESFAYKEDEDHYKKGATVAALFEEEKPEFLPLPDVEFKVSRVDKAKADNTGTVRLDSNHLYYLGPQHSREVMLAEKTAFEVCFYTLDGEKIKEFKREYGDEVTETYDLEQLLAATARKPASWINSIPRAEMGEDSLKKWIDDLSDLKRKHEVLMELTDASLEFGFADACYAAARLLEKGSFPSKYDLSSYCLRLRQGEDTYNPTGVDLKPYDALLGKKEA